MNHSNLIGIRTINKRHVLDLNWRKLILKTVLPNYCNEDMYCGTSLNEHRS